MISRENLLKITDSKGNVYYGGNQDWYSSNTRAQGGCSSVAGANALRALARSDKLCHDTIRSSKKMPVEIRNALLKKECRRDDFLMLMTGIYNTMRSFEVFPLNIIYDRNKRSSKCFKYLKANNGRSSIGFISGVIRFAKKIGLNLACKALPTAFAGKKSVIDFIREGLTVSGSVAILTSYNKHAITTLNPTQCSTMKCHFATITGMDDSKIFLSTWGKSGYAEIDEWVTSLNSIKAWESTLFYFVPTTKRLRNLSLLTSFFPFVKGILQALKRKAQ